MTPTSTAAIGETPEVVTALRLPGDGEGREPGRVEHADEPGDPLDARVEEEGDEATEGRGA